MNFGTLKSRILDLIGRAPADVCYELVTADINQTMRLRAMESTATLVEAASIALPADFLEIVDLYRDVTPRTTLRPVSPQTLNRNYETSGTPSCYAIVDGNILLAPSPSGSENIELRYYAKLADLASDTDENDVLTTYPAIYIYGTLAHHAALIRDEMALPAYFAAYKKAKEQAKASDLNARMAGVPVVPMVRSAP